MNSETVDELRTKLARFWAEAIKPQLAMLLFDDATFFVKAALSQWLDKNMAQPPFDEGLRSQPDSFGKFNKQPEYLIICDQRNNDPPAIVMADVYVFLFGSIVHWKLGAKEAENV